MYANHVLRKVQEDASNVNTIYEGYEILGTITSPLLLELTWPETLKSIWIRGPTSVGKSTWALKHAPKPALYVRHMDILLQFKPRIHKSIIFDDMNFLHLHREAQLQIVDQRNMSQIHVRYKVAAIPRHIPRVFLSNTDIFLWDDAINERLMKITLNWE